MKSPVEVAVYYIASKKLDLSDLATNYKDIKGIIEVVFDDVMTITHMRSKVKGYGTVLFLYACEEAKKRNIELVELDDCSDRYRKPHNIYIKLGMNYIDDYGPEMIGCIRDILSGIQKSPEHAPIASLNPQNDAPCRSPSGRA